MSITKEDDDLLNECVFLKHEDRRPYEEFQITLKKQDVDYLDYIKDQEESVIGKVFGKNGGFFLALFEDIG